MRIVAIKGFDGYYISDSGRVFSVKSDSNELKQLSINRKNKTYVYKNKEQYEVDIAELVYTHFVKDTFTKIFFKDDNYANCNVDNLIDVSEFKFKNCRTRKYSYVLKKRGEK